MRMHQGEKGVMSEKIDTVLFDLGNVLIRWDARNYYKKVFKDDVAGMEEFLNSVCTPEWNHQMDMGRPYAEAIAELKQKWPGKEALIEAWETHWPEMLDGAIEESVAVLSSLRKKNYNLFALTNWSDENFHIARERFEFLQWFKDIVVSGREKMAKPDPAFFKLAEERCGFVPETTVFIDDNLANIETARSLGFNVVHFKNPEQMKGVLSSYGVDF